MSEQEGGTMARNISSASAELHSIRDMSDWTRHSTCARCLQDGTGEGEGGEAL